MTGPSSGIALAVFSVVCALLILKAQVLGGATAATRGKLKKFINPEDARWLGGEHVSLDDDRVQRIFRAHRNDLENFIPFFAGGALYLASGASAKVGVAYFVAFLLARYVHSYAYLGQRAALRRNTFTLGWLITIAMSIHAAWVLVARAL